MAPINRSTGSYKKPVSFVSWRVIVTTLTIATLTLASSCFYLILNDPQTADLPAVSAMLLALATSLGIMAVAAVIGSITTLILHCLFGFPTRLR